MCRMLLAIGEFPVEPLVQGFRRMAQGLLHEHEKNRPKGTMRHPDGWGMLCREDGELAMHHSLVPCWEDADLERVTAGAEGLLLLHARLGPKPRLENVHPFYGLCRGRWWMAHQGTLREELPAERYGTTDSERLFRWLLEKGPDVRRLARFTDFTALNVLLVNEEKAWVHCRRACRPVYNTMHVARLPRGVVVSSERLPGITGWQPIPDGTVLELRHAG